MVRVRQDFGAGLFLIALGAFALWQGADLSVGRLNQLGPGMLPRSLAVLTGLCGLAVVASSFLSAGPPLERWHWRGPLFILGAALAFGLTVRPLGLAVAAPAAIAIAACGSPETRWRETLGFGLIMTVFCLALFKFLLGLPIPVAPWAIGY